MQRKQCKISGNWSVSGTICLPVAPSSQGTMLLEHRIWWGTWHRLRDSFQVLGVESQEINALKHVA